MWLGLALHDDDYRDVQNKLINRYPGMKEMSEKKELQAALYRMQRYFPEDFDFFPRTYDLPGDMGRLQAQLAK